jgi:hypothetical protein
MMTIAPVGVSGLLIHLAPLIGAVAFAVWVALRSPIDTDDRPFHYVPDTDPIDPNVWTGIRQDPGVREWSSDPAADEAFDRMLRARWEGSE